MNFHDFSVKSADGKMISLKDLCLGKVVLVVNVASKCGFTPQYKALEELYEKHKDQGFLILGFPCNQFGNQEPGTNEEIQSFCELNFGVTFPIMSKIDVNGKNADPVYEWMKKEQKGFLGTEFIKWNFTKFLIDKNGNCIARFNPNSDPADLANDIKKAL